MVRIKIKGGEYIQCECGEWYIPVLESQTTCLKCRRKARYEECHKFASEIQGVV